MSAANEASERCDCGRVPFVARWPRETQVVLAAFDAPLDRPPGGHAWYAPRAAWLPASAEPSA